METGKLDKNLRECLAASCENHSRVFECKTTSTAEYSIMQTTKKKKLSNRIPIDAINLPCFYGKLIYLVIDFYGSLHNQTVFHVSTMQFVIDLRGNLLLDSIKSLSNVYPIRRFDLNMMKAFPWSRLATLSLRNTRNQLVSCRSDQ